MMVFQKISLINELINTFKNFDNYPLTTLLLFMFSPSQIRKLFFKNIKSQAINFQMFINQPP